MTEREYYIAVGKWFGYPNCCIEWFISHAGEVLTDQQESVHNGNGFIKRAGGVENFFISILCRIYELIYLLVGNSCGPSKESLYSYSVTKTKHMEHVINPAYYQDFILSGKPEFTLRSTKNKVEEIFTTYLYQAPEWSCAIRNRQRETLGWLRLVKEATEFIYHFDQRSRHALMAYQIKQQDQFEWFWSKFMQGVLPSYIQIINHTGRCGHCHRELTHPESIPIGIGPDCFKKLGLQHKQLISIS